MSMYLVTNGQQKVKVYASSEEEALTRGKILLYNSNPLAVLLPITVTEIDKTKYEALKTS